MEKKEHDNQLPETTPADSAAMNDTYVCPGCGAKVKKGQQHCSNCGTQFQWDGNRQKTDKKKEKSFYNSIGFKVLIICLVSVGLLIPGAFISSLSGERKANAASAQREMSAKWGLPQYITGPILQMPFNEGKEKSNHYILPKELNVSADVRSKTLHRSIYDVVVYDTDIDMSGSFSIRGLLPEKNDSLRTQPDKSKLKIGLTDLRGIVDKLTIEFGGKTYDLNDGGTDCNFQNSSGSGVYSSYGDARNSARNRLEPDFDFSFDNGSDNSEAVSRPSLGSVAEGKIDLSQYLDSTDIPFKLHMKLKGSEALGFAPIGETTRVNVKGDFPNPSFGGGFLPNEREVKADGFTASWKVISINRPYPQSFSDDLSYPITNSQVHVAMKTQVDNFRKTDRAIKYAFLVIVLTLVAALFVELRTRRPINAFQYLLVGLALVLFYSLLLSFGEYIAFGWAYLIAAGMTVSMVTLYLIGVLQVKKQALMVGGLLAILYSYIYILLNLETYALLVGSIGLFLILALIMYYSLDLTRKGAMPKE